MKHQQSFLRKLSDVFLSIVFLTTYMPAPAWAGARPGRVSPGVQASENLTEGYLDILAPLWDSETSLLFFNPKVTGNDQDESELNLGVGGSASFLKSGT